jgi:hypothetical protein
VLLPGSHSRDCERIRKRLKVAGYSGNRELSVKRCQNRLLQGIQYCGKEGPPHEIGGDEESIHGLTLLRSGSLNRTSELI